MSEEGVGIISDYMDQTLTAIFDAIVGLNKLGVDPFDACNIVMHATNQVASAVVREGASRLIDESGARG